MAVGGCGRHCLVGGGTLLTREALTGAATFPQARHSDAPCSICRRDASDCCRRLQTADCPAARLGRSLGLLHRFGCYISFHWRGLETAKAVSRFTPPTTSAKGGLTCSIPKASQASHPAPDVWIHLCDGIALKQQPARRHLELHFRHPAGSQSAPATWKPNFSQSAPPISPNFSQLIQNAAFLETGNMDYAVSRHPPNPPARASRMPRFQPGLAAPAIPKPPVAVRSAAAGRLGSKRPTARMGNCQILPWISFHAYHLQFSENVLALVPYRIAHLALLAAPNMDSRNVGPFALHKACKTQQRTAVQAKRL